MDLLGLLDRSDEEPLKDFAQFIFLFIWLSSVFCSFIEKFVQFIFLFNYSKTSPNSFSAQLFKVFCSVLWSVIQDFAQSYYKKLCSVFINFNFSLISQIFLCFRNSITSKN